MRSVYGLHYVPLIFCQSFHQYCLLSKSPPTLFYKITLIFWPFKLSYIFYNLPVWFLKDIFLSFEFCQSEGKEMVFQCCLFVFISLISRDLEYRADFLAGGGELAQTSWGQSAHGRTSGRALAWPVLRPRRRFPDPHSCLRCPAHTWEASSPFQGVEGAIAQLSPRLTDSREFRQEPQVQFWGQGTRRRKESPRRRRPAGWPGRTSAWHPKALPPLTGSCDHSHVTGPR